MVDPTILAKTLDSASKVANTPFFITLIDKATGFKLSEWAAEGEVRKQIIHDEYQKAKEAGVVGMDYIEYMRSNQNLINTAIKASKYIENGKPNEIQMNNDLFWNTIEHSKTVSDEQVQEVIAKVLAGEYNNPGKFLNSTLQTLKMLGKEELENFQRIGSLCITHIGIPVMVFNKEHHENDFLKELELNFEKFQQFQSLGLVLPNSMTRHQDNKERKPLRLHYFDDFIRYLPKVGITDYSINMPHFNGLSLVGKQIMSLLNPIKNNNYFIWLENNYKIKNYEYAGRKGIWKTE